MIRISQIKLPICHSKEDLDAKVKKFWGFIMFHLIKLVSSRLMQERNKT